MVIIGIDERTRTTGTGTFHCPNCGPNREYRRLSRGQYATFFFIPLVQLTKLSEGISCKNCCTQFETSVLFHNPEIERRERAERIKLVMILTSLQGDRSQGDGMSEAALRVIEEAVYDDGGEKLSRDDLQQDIAEASALEMDPLIDLIRLSQKLQPQGGSTVLKYAFLAASAEGSLSEGHSIFLQELREALGVSEAGFRRIIATASQDRTSQNAVNQNTVEHRPQP
jgi:hypothetical protein